MKKIVLGALVAVLAALVAALPSAASHAAEDPYQDAVCDISVSPQPVQGGQDFTVTVTSDRPADLSVTFGDDTRSEQGVRELAATFRAPAVSEAQTVQVAASCDGVARSASVQIVPAGDSAGEDAGGTVGSALGGILPSTGGAALWLLLLGAALAVAGGTVLVRRRS